MSIEKGTAEESYHIKPSFNEIFSSKKPVIGMLHLDYLLGADDFKGLDYVIFRAIKDISALQTGGIDGILIENWKEDSIGEFVDTQTAVSFAIVVNEICRHINVPFGINVLNNDYKVALSVAKLTGASFVQLDVFVDRVMSNFSHSPKASKSPFEINTNPNQINEYTKSIGADNIPLFVFVQPKHYILLEERKRIEKSVEQAIKGGASAVLVTKETGSAPTLYLIKRTKSVAGNIPVGIGSGFSAKNANEFMSIVDFAVVGTSIKVGENADNQVDINKVKELMTKVKALRTQ